MAAADQTPWWTWVAPLFAVVLVVVAKSFGINGIISAIAAVALIGAVFAAVHHAEVVAHRIGEPFGSLVLAVAVTTIEVALIISVMIADASKVGLARDAVFAAVMLAANGVVGLCLLIGGMRYYEQDFKVQGASAALAVLAALTVLTLILPNFTESVVGPEFSPPQLLFEGAISLVLYAAFIFVQTIRHRDYFLPVDDSKDTHAPAPPRTVALISAGLLLVSLVAVVGLAKVLTPAIEMSMDALQAPKAVVGIIIAALVILPEGLAAVRAARANRLQTSLNLALGSALASIGLTIPTVAVVAIVLHQHLELGLSAINEILLELTLLVGVITLGTGRTTVLQGIVHLTILATFVFLAFVP